MSNEPNEFLDSLNEFNRFLNKERELMKHFWIFWEDYKLFSLHGKLYIEFLGKLINKSEKEIKAIDCYLFLEERGSDETLIVGRIDEEISIPANQEIKYEHFIQFIPDHAGHEKLRELRKENKWPLLSVDRKIASRIERLEFSDGTVIE